MLLNPGMDPSNNVTTKLGYKSLFSNAKLRVDWMQTFIIGFIWMFGIFINID